MDSLSSLLSHRFQPGKPVRRPNKIWDLAKKVADITGDPPQRWLLRAKNDRTHIERALIAIQELPSHNKAAHFQWWYKKYKNETSKSS